MSARTMAAVQARLDQAAFGGAWERGRALTVDEAVELALGARDGAL